MTMLAAYDRDAKAWALRIAARWRASIESIIETGQLLVDAKLDLPHGEFEAMIDRDLPFGASTARRLMAIASDKRLSNRAHVHVLPASWGTLYELTKLSDEEFDRAIESNLIRPDMERQEVGLIRPTPPRAAPTASISGSLPPDTGTTQCEDRASPDPSEVPSMPGGGLAIAHRRVEPDDSLDYFPTPPWATRALFEHVLVDMPNPADNSYDVWEPACGEGHMAEVLREYCGVEVLATDIFDYGYGDRVLNFHSDDAKQEQRDWIITNPPFADSTDFVLKALHLAGTGVAMFVRLTWLESVGRYERIFRDQPPTLLAIFTERVPLHRGRWESEGGTMTAYIWLVWIKGEQPRAPFWIPPGCREALTQPDDAERFTQHPVAKRSAQVAA